MSDNKSLHNELISFQSTEELERKVNKSLRKKGNIWTIEEADLYNRYKDENYIMYYSVFKHIESIEVI